MKPHRRTLRIAPPVARLSVPLGTRRSAQEAGRLLQALGKRLETMGGACRPEDEIAMLFYAWQEVLATKRQLAERIKIDAADPESASDTP